MGSLTTCIKKAGSALADDDRAAIIERSRALRGEGKGANEAAMQAVREQLAAVQALLTPAAPAGDDAAKQKAKDDLKNALGDLAALLTKPGRLGITEEQEQALLPILTRVFDAAFRLGHMAFKDAARFVLEQVRGALGAVADEITVEHLQGSYIAMSGRYKDRGASPKRDVLAVDSIDELTENQDRASDPDANLERDRADAAPAQPDVGAAVQDGGSGAAQGARSAGGEARSRRARPANDPGVPAGGAVARGERGDQRVDRGERADGPAEFDAGADVGKRGLDLGKPGVPADAVATEQVARAADAAVARSKKSQAQRDAESIKVEPGLDNIRATLPYLLPEQQEDVHKAEQRFAKPDGYGMLFTNGTGTGKTFTGLGTIKRFARQGKTSQLILVPDAKIMADWIDSAKNLGLTITPLRDTKDAGAGIVITTYANAGENNALVHREWDLVTADEAHQLMQGKDGEATAALGTVRAITRHPSYHFSRHAMLHADELAELRALGEQLNGNLKILNNPDTMDQMMDAVRAENKKLQAQADALAAKMSKAADDVRADVLAKQGAARTRAQFLSATPFAYEFTVDWAEGYLFDYPRTMKWAGGYNVPTSQQQFMIQHFGYRMRTGKLTKPDANVDSGLMQRQFNGWLRKQGALSGRTLDVEHDYDRKFVLVDSAIGNRIDAALDWVSDKASAENDANYKAKDDAPKSRGFDALNAAIRDALYGPQGHLVRRYLLEAIKAKEAVPIIRQHLALGRKVVVFHDFKKGGARNPFALEADPMPPHRPDMPWPASEHDKRTRDREAYLAALAEFNRQFPDLTDGDALSGLISPIARFSAEFPDVLLINGDEKPADLLARYKRFNDDAQGPIVALVQSAKNKGWSGHDTTGKYPRVLFNLGLPTQPTMTIQQEGRIYRVGQASNAMFRYFNTGTTWERWAFAQTIARRASEAENLGQGEQARALLDAFVSGYEESDAYPPGHDGEGTGGKERDRALANVITEYDRAKSYYWGTQKKNSKTKAQEGQDYFATPEPVGLKMVEWLGLRGGESFLEPSAGHGAIARWAPDNVERAAIEPSMQLRSKLALSFDGKIVDGRFEDHHVVNKYDGIAMNPPFGTAGRTAVDHIAKAATHLRDGGRIVALLPTGPSADAKFEKWFDGEETRKAEPMGSTQRVGDYYKGDTVTLDGADGRFTIVGSGQYGVELRRAGGDTTTFYRSHYFETVTPGPRVEKFKPAEGLYLVADVKLPAVTFERAGTGAMTRIVVIEKQTDNARAPAHAKSLDYTSVDDINVLFDKLEDVAMPPRTMTPEQEQAERIESRPNPAEARAQAKAEKQVAQAAGAEIAQQQGAKIVEHTTQKGKLIKGVIRTDLTKDQAQEIDPYTWRKDGGYFIRLQHLEALNAKYPPAAPSSGNAEPLQDIRRTSDRIMRMGYERQDAPRVQAGRRLAGLIKRLDSGEITPLYFERAVRALSEDIDTAVTTKAANRLMADRERGADMAREKLIRARRQGDIAPEAADLALWLIDQNPALADSVSLSVRAPKDDAASADYNPATEVIRLFKGRINAANADSIAHEFMHHAERMMPPEMQKAIREEWAKSLAKAIKAATPEQVQALMRIADAVAGDKNASQALVDAITGGPLNYDDHYQLVNPSEFWAVNAARILSERHDAASVWAKVKQWLSELVEKIKGLVGMRSDAPILKAIDEVLSGPGRRQSKTMLSDTKAVMAMGGTLQAVAADSPEAHALRALSENDEIFALPKSSATTIVGIAADIDPAIKVEAHPAEGLDRYTLTMPNGDTAELFVRTPSPYGPHSYGTARDGDKPRIVRPGEDRESMRDVDDVWINVSKLKTGGGGAKIYAIAGDFAHNTGRVFIGDPAGVTDAAMRRRPEQMLSSALRWGTTEHLAPHPRQQVGEDAIGVPSLRWVEGDHLGNIRRLIDVNLQALKNAGYDDASISFDLGAGTLRDSAGNPISRADLGTLAKTTGFGERGLAGRNSLARAAVLRALLREEGGPSQGRDGRRDDLLARLASLAADRPSAVAKLFDLTRQKAPAGWANPAGTKFDDFAYKFQDSKVDLRRSIEAIRKEGRAIEERFDAYLQEELYHGRTAARVEDFAETELRPLLAEMRLRAITQDRLNQYLHARHAEEANEHVAAINDQLPDGGSGMATADAKAFLDGLDAAERKRLEAIAAKVDAIIAKTREAYVAYGLESKTTVDGWAEMFDHYVPLQREDHDGAMGIGQGFNIKGRETKQRTGSTAAVSDILANIAMQREKAVVRGEKNRVAVAMVGLVATNPNPDVWDFGPIAERRVNPATGMVETMIKGNWRNADNVLTAKIIGKDGAVHERAIVFNENDERAKRMVTSLKNLDAQQLEGLIGVVGKVTRYFASINTQYNPIFGVVNFTRDIGGTQINLTSTPINGKQAQVTAYALKFLGEAARAGFRMDKISDQALWDEFRREGGITGFRQMFTTTADRAEAIRKEMDPQHWQKTAVGKVMTVGGLLNVPTAIGKSTAAWVLDQLSNYNEALENVTRLAAYKVAKDAGLSNQQAASIAKNLTVNFNRKGQQATTLGALFAFFNASMQGTARLGQVMFSMEGGNIKTLRLTKKGAAVVAGGVAIGALQAIALAAAGFDEDEPPEFVRERNLIIPIGDKKYVTIPMPLGLHVIPNSGRIATELVLRGGKEPGKAAGKMLGLLAEAFNPIGNAGLSLQTVAPTVLDPVVALVENRDFTGRPIAKQSFDKAQPGHANARDVATAHAKWIAAVLNDWTGGTDYTRGAISPTPDQIDYLIGQFTGGVGREIAKASQTVTALRTGEDLPPHKIPLVGRFYGDAASVSNEGSRFYTNLERMREHKAMIEGLSKDQRLTGDHRRDAVKRYRDEHPDASMYMAAEKIADRVSDLRKHKRRLLEDRAPREKVKEIEAQIVAVERQFNEAVKAAQSGPKADHTKPASKASQAPAMSN